MKFDARKPIQRHRTEEEAIIALQALYGAKDLLIDAQVEDDHIVLYDVIKELIEKRSIIEDIKGFVSVWNTRLYKR